MLGAEIAKTLRAPLDLVIPRKIGHPFSPEYAIAAVTEHGDCVKNEDEVKRVDAKWFARAVEEEVQEAKRRRRVYCGNRAMISPTRKTAIIVDDGIATGLTMRAAIADIKKQNPAKIIIAVPVAPKETAEEMRKDVDDFVAVDIPESYLGAVGAYYEEFPQVEDEEVIKMLR